MPLAQFQFQLPVAAFQKALQLLHALARHDDLPLATCRSGIQSGFAQRQAVTVGGHAAQGIVAQIEQQAVEVVTDVLLRHGECRAFQQFFQRGFGYCNPFGGIHFVQRREIIGGQAGQREPAATGLHRHLVAILADGDTAAVGQSTHDLEQLACGDRGFTILRLFHGHARNHFDFEIGAGHRQLAGMHLDQQVGQYRQGMPALDDIDDLCQWLEQNFALQGKPHVNPRPSRIREQCQWRAPFLNE